MPDPAFEVIYSDEHGRQIVRCEQIKMDPRLAENPSEVFYRVRHHHDDLLKHVPETEAMALKEQWSGDIPVPPGQ